MMTNETPSPKLIPSLLRDEILSTHKLNPFMFFRRTTSARFLMFKDSYMKENKSVTLETSNSHD